MKLFYYYLLPLVASLARASVVENGSILQIVLKELKEFRENQQECHAKLVELDVLRMNLREINAKLVEFEKLKTRVNELKALALMSKVEATYDENNQLDEQLSHPVESLLQENVENSNKQGHATKSKVIDNTTNYGPYDNSSNIGIVRKRQQPEYHQVAFSSHVSAEDLNPLGIQQTIIFDSTLSNIGNAYHSQTGIFIAPYNGVYVFHLSAMSLPGNYQYLEIVRDGNFVSSILVDAHGNEGHETSSTLCVLELDKDSEVWIRTGNAGQIHGRGFTTFSGWLLYATE